MADLLKFKHGLQANLKQNSPAVVAGTVYITRDERAMYVDLPAYQHDDGTLEQAKRIRIGDLRNYEYLSEFQDALKTDMSELTSSALYYARYDNPTDKKEINALLKWDNTQSKFVQLNSTAEVTASLSALAGRVSIVEGKVSTLETKVDALENNFDSIDDTYATKAALNSAVDTLNGEIAKKANQSDLTALSGTVTALSKTVSDNKAEAETAIEGVANDLSAEVTRAKKAEGENLAKINTNSENIGKNTQAIATLNGSDTTAGSVAKTVKDAVAVETNARVQAIQGVQGSITAIEGDISTIKAKNNSQDTEINKKVDIAQDDPNKVMITDANGNVTTGAAVASKLTYLSDVDGNIGAKFTAVNNAINTTNENVTGLTTRMDAAEQAIEAAEKDIDDLQADLAALKGDGDGSIADQIEAAVAAEAALRAAADQTHTTNISANSQAIATLRTDLSNETTAREGVANDLAGYKTTVSNTYLSKTDASNTYLKKADASTTYATKTELANEKTAILGEANYAGTVKGAYALANAAQTQADSGVSKADAAQGAIDAYITSNNKALADEIARAKAAEKDNADDIAALSEAHAKDKKDLSDAIAAETTRAEGVEGNHETRIAKMETFWAAADNPEGTIDKLAEIVNYIAADKEGALDMAADIKQNADDIDALEGRMTTAEGSITTLNTNLNKEITAREGAVTDAINTAKEYTNDALEWGTF